MEDDAVTTLIEDATLDYTLGETDAALQKLAEALRRAPDSFAAWHAQAEVYFSLRQLDEALQAAEKAVALKPDDIHIHTSLSRIWMERGDKPRAEHHGAQARMLSWKDELKEPPATG